MKRVILALLLCAGMVGCVLAEDAGSVTTGVQRFSGSKIFRQDGLTTTTATGNITLSLESTKFQKIAPNGSNRDVTLPAEENNKGLYYFIWHGDGANTVTVKDDAASTVVTLNTGEACIVACDGGAWAGVVFDASASGFLAADGSVAGATGQAQDFGTNGIKADVVAESTGATGVTVDGVLLKDTTVDVNGTADAIILDADGDTTISAPTGNQIDIEINNADDFTFTANTFTALSGSSVATNTIAETTAGSGVTIDSVLVKDGGILAAGSGLVDLAGIADCLVLDDDGDTTISSPTDDQIDIEISNADDFQFTANTFTALSGSTIKADTIAETTGAAGVTFSHTVNAPAVLGSDSSLGITGQAGSGGAGGAIVATGGAGDTDANGGAVSAVGGAGNGTGLGGAVVLTGGLAGATNAVGGAATITAGAGNGTGNGAVASMTGGASGGGATGTGGVSRIVGGASAATNGAGGAAQMTGGAGAGTGAGGAATIVGGASGAGATGNGGAISATGGAALSTNGNGGAADLVGGVATGTGTGGAVTITSGASAGAGGTAGSIAIDAGNEAGGTAGTITIGGTEAGAITIGRSGQTVTFPGTVARTSQKYTYAASFGHVGATAGFVTNAAADTNLVTCPQSQTASTFVVPVPYVNPGATITGFGLIGQIESGGNAVTVDADLRVHTAAAGDVADASVGTMTQISKNADYAITATDDKGSLAHSVDTDESFYVLITVTTNASCDVAIQAITVVYTED